MKRRSTVPIRKRFRLPEAPESLSATSRALYGISDPGEPDALQPEAESVEDALEDCPESTGDEQVRPPRYRDT
jgi:hypothetical protein